MKNPGRLIVFVFAALVCARVLGIVSVYFFEEDEVALAVGASALVAGTPGDLYRYTVQVGYYRLIEMLDLMVGGRIDLIPSHHEGRVGCRWRVDPHAGFLRIQGRVDGARALACRVALAVNPIIWQSSRYGNTALLATALATAGIVLLSNRPARAGRILALTLVGAATLVRADTRAAPAHRARARVPHEQILACRGNLGSGLRTGHGAGVWGNHGDRPQGRQRRPVRVQAHEHRPTHDVLGVPPLGNLSVCRRLRRFWGMRTLLDSRAGLFGLLLLWGVPSLLFYFRAVTTARYFLIAAVPLSIAAAVGMSAVVDLLRQWLRPRLAWTFVIGAASVHLFVALGHVPSDRPAEWFTAGRSRPTTGRCRRAPSWLERSWPLGRCCARCQVRNLGARTTPSGRVCRSTERSLSWQIPGHRAGRWSSFCGGASATRSITIPTRLAPGSSRARRGVNSCGGVGKLWFTLGNSRVMAIGAGMVTIARFRGSTWPLVTRSGRSEPTFRAEVALAHVPAGLGLSSIPSFDPHFQTFAVVGR